MNKPTSHRDFDIEEIDAALAAEKAARKAPAGRPWRLFLVLGLGKLVAGLFLVIPHT